MTAPNLLGSSRINRSFMDLLPTWLAPTRTRVLRWKGGILVTSSYIVMLHLSKSESINSQIINHIVLLTFFFFKINSIKTEKICEKSNDLPLWFLVVYLIILFFLFFNPQTTKPTEYLQSQGSTNQNLIYARTGYLKFNSVCNILYISFKKMIFIVSTTLPKSQ